MSSRITAYIDIECQSEREFGFDRLAMRIAKFPNVMDVAVISGKSDLQLQVEAKDMHEISKFVTEILAPMEGVKRTSTHFLMKPYKKNGKILEKEPKDSRLPISA